MIKAIRRASVLAALLTLAGCAVLQPGVSQPQASRNTAVVALLDQSRTQASSGRLGEASASLERALRIEPRNPALWQELARIRLDQGQFREAENLAAKSNALAGENRGLRAGNWRIIGQARTSLGDLQGAREAFERAERKR